MRRFKALLAAACLVLGSVSLSVCAADYQEGVHYEKRAEHKSAQPEIREFFSFWCGHCYAMQDMFHRIEAKFAGKAAFVKNPIEVMGGAAGPESQKALAVASLIGIEDEFMALLFKRMHQDGEIPASFDDMIYVFEELGIPASKVKRDYASFPVQGMVAGWNSAAKDLKIDAVPEIVVNGKYLVNMSSVDNEEEFIDLIGYVLTLD